MVSNPSKPLLLIVDDDPLIVDSLEYFLAADFAVAKAGSRAEALGAMRTLEHPPALCLVDLGLPPVPHRPLEGFALITELLVSAPQMRIVVLSGQNDSENARHARTLGAVEFVAKPADPERLRALLLRLLQLPPGQGADGGMPMLGESPLMQQYRLQLRQFADSPFSVLIEGESGSGKELAAATLHHLSPRREKPYLVLNCAAIAPTLIESTLFGHARGAFTGASQARPGYFEEATEGTLLLDEIGELPLDLQPKLLRVLENGEYQRVGETQTRVSRTRILAATNRDLRAEVRSGRFRADLYHRLSVFSVSVPPLRLLGEDRMKLLAHFSRQLAESTGQRVFELSPESARLWMIYDFPGNVRELRNIVIRLGTRYPGQIVTPNTLREEFDPGFSAAQEQPVAVPADRIGVPATATEREAMVADACRHLEAVGPEFLLDAMLTLWEDVYIEAALRLSNNNISQTARRLGINRTTLYNRLEALARERSSN